MKNSRAARAAALEELTERVHTDDLVQSDTAALQLIAELAEQRDDVDAALVDAVRSARAAHRSWSEIGAMLGVSKQAAQRKYSKLVSPRSTPRKAMFSLSVDGVLSPARADRLR